MIKYCDHCWTNYDTERSGEYFCPKCISKEGISNGLEKRD